jgi:hypothetical protein
MIVDDLEAVERFYFNNLDDTLNVPNDAGLFPFQHSNYLIILKYHVLSYNAFVITRDQYCQILAF